MSNIFSTPLRLNLRLTLSLILCFNFVYPQAENILGDINNDEIVDILDLVSCVNMIIDPTNNLTEYETWASDVNNDEFTNVLDLVITVNFVLGNLQQACIIENEIFVPCYADYTGCCYPTTSHEFTWEFYEFGEPGSHINDLAVINENNIWAAGLFKEIDTTTWDGYHRYNLAHWDGVEWELIDLSLPFIPNGVTDTSWYVFETQMIHAINENDIWIQNHDRSFGHWDGMEWTGYFWAQIAIKHKAWSTSSESVWFSGHGGVHYYDGIQFQEQISFWINHRLTDIWGISEDRIWTTGYQVEPSETILLEFDGTEWFIKNTSDGTEPCGTSFLCGFTGAVWAFGDTLYVSSAQNGIWHESISTGSGWLMEDPAEFVWGSWMGLRGNHYNDIFHFSEGCHFYHYNGIDWEYSDALIAPYTEEGWPYAPHQYSVYVNGDFIVLGGKAPAGNGSKAWVAKGYRNQ
ncbi:MAG: hypothetical protein H8E72_02480 [Candidatus Marinimicrobia bacterium]|nr:hypothetical protein [Candidatus Neomarinimicrobiota bacterium]